ncbi:hypothetical protein ACNUDM_08455 [Vibrio chaetopteri]|uniref:hypothetical protein n=1 Tax=Vibrio chaetopteri TaxID=3016528 RepID=UPI003AB5BABA
MFKKSIIVSAAVLSLAACQSTQSTVEQAQQFAQCTFPDSPTHEAPSWVCDVMPQDLGAGAMGYAKKSRAGIGVMRERAVNAARVQLASQFQTDVSNMFREAIEGSVLSSNEAEVESVTETFESVTQNVVTQNLTNSKLIVSQVSPAGGLYVLVGMDKDTFKSNVNQVVDQASEAKLWNQFNNEKAEQELSNALNSLKSM